MVLRLQLLECCTTRFMRRQLGKRQLASRHWHACTREWMQRCMDSRCDSCGLLCLGAAAEVPSSRSKPNFSIL